MRNIGLTTMPSDGQFAPYKHRHRPSDGQCAFYKHQHRPSEGQCAPYEHRHRPSDGQCASYKHRHRPSEGQSASCMHRHRGFQTEPTTNCKSTYEPFKGRVTSKTRRCMHKIRYVACFEEERRCLQRLYKIHRSL